MAGIEDEEFIRARRRFERLTALYPRLHRQQHGAALRDTLLDQYRAQPQCLRQSPWFWGAQVADAFAGAARLHAYFFLAMKGVPKDRAAVRAGLVVGLTTGACFALGAFLYNASALFAGVGEAAANLICLLLLVLACAGSGYWAARQAGALRHGSKAGMLTGGLIGLATGLSYLLLDMLLPAVVRPEKHAAFAHSRFALLRTFLLVTDLEATLALMLPSLVVGLLLGSAGAGASLLRRKP